MTTVQQEDTVVFTPRWDDQPGDGKHAGPVKALCNCQAGGCPDMYPKPVPDTRDALLSCAPGVVTRMSRERVRNGEWEDIAAASRTGALRVHKPAVDHLSRIRLDLEHGVLDMHPVFDRNPALHTDTALGHELRRLEADLAADLDDMRRRSGAGEKQPWHRVARRAA